MERMGISYSKYVDLRLLLLDRIEFPTEDSVRATTKDMRVELEEFKHGVRDLPNMTSTIILFV